MKNKLNLKKWNRHHPFRVISVANAVFIILAVTICPVFAEDLTMWTKAKDFMQSVYNQIVTISTIAAVVCSAVALLLMNFSKSSRTVDESRSWLKRIIISWVILNGLGFIIAYITPFLEGGKWTG